MKKLMYIGMLLLTVVLSACGVPEEEIITSNLNRTMIQDLTATRLANISYEEQQAKFDEYRTRMEFEVWERKFDTEIALTQHELAIAEHYLLVPKRSRIVKLVEDVTDESYRYLVVAEMTAVPENGDLTDPSIEQKIFFTYWYTFNKEGILIDIHEKHRKDGITV